MFLLFTVLIILAGSLLPTADANALIPDNISRDRRLLLELLDGGADTGDLVLPDVSKRADTNALTSDNIDRDRRLLLDLLGGGGAEGGGSGGLLGGLLGGGSGGGGLLGGLLGGGGKGGGGLLGGLLGGGGKGGGLLGGLLGGGSGGGLLGGLLGGKNGGLLGGLLGGGKGGLLGGLLGGNGLLGGLLGGGKGGGLLGGLLGGGKGGGLLGSLLGGNGLLGGLLGGGKGGGLLGGLLGGGGGGLLGGLLGGGKLLEILGALFCLIEKLGLQLVLDLLNGLGAHVLLGLNEIACMEGGDSLLDLLVSKNGLLPLPIIEEVLCLVKGLGLPSVVHLLEDAGLEKVLGLKNMTCPDGIPLLEEGSSAAKLLDTLLGILDIDTVSKVGLDGILKLDKLISKEGIVDLPDLIKTVLCLIQKLGLGDVIEIIDIVGVSGLLRVNDVVCSNSTSLVDLDIAVRAGLKVNGIIPMLLKVIDLNTMVQLISQAGIASMIRLGNALVINGTLQVQILNEVLCISTSLGLTGVVNLIEKTDLTAVLGLHVLVCPNRQPIPLQGEANLASIVQMLETCKKGNLEQCLDGLATSILQNDAIVCVTCKFIGIAAVSQECSSACSTP